MHFVMRHEKANARHEDREEMEKVKYILSLLQR